MSAKTEEKTPGNGIDPTEVFPEVENLIYRICHRYVKTYPVSWEDIIGEAHDIFMKACEKYDPARGMKFSSYVYFLVSMKLKTFIMRRSAAPDEVEINEDVVGFSDTPHRVFSLTEDLSEDAREIIGLIHEIPDDFIEFLGASSLSTKNFMKKLRYWLVETGSHFPRELNKVEEEIESRFRRQQTTDEWMVDRFGISPGRVRAMTSEENNK